jgi:phage-related protein (TIGR01555 family)
MAENEEKVYGDSVVNLLKSATIQEDAKADIGLGVRTLQDSVASTKDKIEAAAKKSTVITDHYRNTLTATGTADKAESFTSYGYNNDTLNWPLWMALYNDSWVFKRAIDKPAQDEVNAGFVINTDKDVSKIYKAFGKYKKAIINLLKWGALFGGSIAVMMFASVPDDEMKLPINKAKIKGSRMKLYVTDRWYGVSPSNDTVDNMADLDFGKPKKYQVTFADGKTLEVDHSYVLRYEHRDAPQLIKNGQLQGWGYAEGAHILNELSRDDQLKSAITSLVNKSLIEVIKMAGMKAVFMGTDKANETQLRKRLEMVNWGRSYNSLTFLDKDDEYQEHGFTGMTGLADLMEKNMWLIASALEMQGILYGELKGGLSQDTDAYKHYATTIENRCNDFYRPVLQKLLQVLYIMYDIEGTVDFDFKRLDEVEQNDAKMGAAEKLSGILDRLLDKKVISKYQYAVSIQNVLSKNILSINFSNEYLDALKMQEDYDVLEIIKEAGKTKASKEEIVGTQFGGSDLPDELSYLDPNKPDEAAESIGAVEPEPVAEATESGEPSYEGEEEINE